MFDLHTHSLLSDGVLLPSELARRYEEKGYQAIAITDHVDTSNIKRVVSEITHFCKTWPKNRIRILPGIELTHLPLEHFKPLVTLARKKGIKIIVGHGQSPVEPVSAGTNKAAILSGINILAHPGNITEEEALLAKKHNVFLEITTRQGHKTTNEHVIRTALKTGAQLILNSDTHTPDDILTLAEKIQQAKNFGLNDEQINHICDETRKFLDRI